MLSKTAYLLSKMPEFVTTPTDFFFKLFSQNYILYEHFFVLLGTKIVNLTSRRIKSDIRYFSKKECECKRAVDSRSVSPAIVKKNYKTSLFGNIVCQINICAK